jgi:hypothetical protein
MLSFALVEARIVLRSDASELRMAVQPGEHLKNMLGSAEPRQEVNLATVKGNQHLLFLPLDCAVSLSFGRLPSVFLSLSCSVFSFGVSCTFYSAAPIWVWLIDIPCAVLFIVVHRFTSVGGALGLLTLPKWK